MFWRLLLCRRLEHGHAKSLHEYHLLPDRLVAADQLPSVWILRLECHGELHVVYSRVLLQCDPAVGRFGRLFGRLLLPGRVDVDHAENMHQNEFLSRDESKSNSVRGDYFLSGRRFERADCMHCWSLLCRHRSLVRIELQRRLLLRDGLEHGDPVCMQCWFLLPGGQLEHDALYSRFVLRRHWSVGAQRHVHGRLLLRDGLRHAHAKPVHESHLLPAR
jgi:hypothetical protein